jgi:hypothetical protein
MFNLYFDTSNEAFQGSGSDEIARVLRELAARIDKYGADDHGVVRDINGNKIGAWSYTQD